ncbi:MAG: hemerythrin domain-containing protein, partial [Kribbellaceae bacterium]|nr:hemerythrin domain-containing protein [Kribbellaceae bacterium]
ESTMLFPGLVEQHPDLAEAVAVLQHEHEKIAVLLDQLKQEVSLDQVDELIAQLNVHLDREEAELLPYL